MPKELQITNITFYLPKEAKMRLKKFSQTQGTSISWLMRNFVDTLIKDVKLEIKKEGE